MKYRLIIIICAILNSSFCIAQTNWAPIGSKWFYNIPSPETGGYVHFESVKDSAITGKSVRVIKVSLNNDALVGWEYFHQSGDTLFYFNHKLKAFFPLYNFAAKVGDTIEVHADEFIPNPSFFSDLATISEYKYTIVAIDSIQLSNRWFKRQRVESLLNQQWGFEYPDGQNRYVLNGIGSLDYLFGMSPNVYPEMNPVLLRCYSENGFEYTNPLWNFDCNYVTGIQNNQQVNGVELYPTQVKQGEVITIEVQQPLNTIQVFNALGVLKGTFTVNATQYQLNTGGLPVGYYMVLVDGQAYKFLVVE